VSESSGGIPIGRQTAGRWRITWGWAAGLLLLLLARPVPASILIGLPFVLLGELIRVVANGSLIKEKQLTNWGIYAHLRHPLYVGSTLIGFGFVIMARSVWLAIPMTLIFLLVYSRTVRREDERMEHRYGDLYREWAERVPRFFPRRLSISEIGEHFTLKRAWVNREHQGVLGVAVATGVLYLFFLLFHGSIALAAGPPADLTPGSAAELQRAGLPGGDDPDQPRQTGGESLQNLALRLDAADVTAIVGDLGFQRLQPPAPVLYLDRFEGAGSEARALQIALLEANGFWRSMTGGFIEGGGVIFTGSQEWAALRSDRSYGFPAVRVMTAGDGLLTILPAESTSQFSENAAETVRISPLSARGPLIAHGLASEAGAASYVRAWLWVLHAEGLAESLRIKTDYWWQRRLLGGAAACMFLESPRGAELAPGMDESLMAWSEFWMAYLHPRAIGLATTGRRPPTGDLREILELEARLFTLSRELWRQHRMPVIERFRSAWPVDGESADPLEALEAFWSAFPEQREEWEWRLLTPLEPPPPPDPGSSTPSSPPDSNPAPAPGSPPD